MSLISRPYTNEYDYYRIREFLNKTLLLNNRQQINWHVYRWDYWRWHVNANIFAFKLDEVVSLWETEDGELAAVLHPDGRGEAFLQVHPRYRTPQLVSEMLDVAEKKFPAPAQDGKMKLHIWAHEQDETLKTTLAQHNFTQTESTEYQRWRIFDQAIPEVNLPEGYTLRSLGGDEDLPARSWASWRAFHPTEPDEKYLGWRWYYNVQHAPLYCRDLDLVATAPNGEIASFVTIWYDEATKTGAFEPVGTQPQYQRKGLAKALLARGLRLLKERGAVMAYVGSYDPGAHAAYESVGFKQYTRSEMWVKMF